MERKAHAMLKRKATELGQTMLVLMGLLKLEFLYLLMHS